MPSSHRATFPMFALAAAAIVWGGIQAASIGPLRIPFWGFHAGSFLPIPVVALGWCVGLAAVWMLFRGKPLGGRSVGGASRSGKSGIAWAPRVIKSRWRVGMAIGLAVASGVVFWGARSHQTFLGDSLPLITDLPTGKSFHPRQPLSMWLQQRLYTIAARREGTNGRQAAGSTMRGGAPPAVSGVSPASALAYDAVARGSVGAGVLFVLIAVGLGHLLATAIGRFAPWARAPSGKTGVGENGAAGDGTRHIPTSMPWWIALVLVTQGYALLFFGYVENYAYVTVAIAAYLLAGLGVVVGGGSLVAVAVVLVVATGLHLSAIALYPSFAFLVWWAIARADRPRTLGPLRWGPRLDAVIALGVFAAAVAALDAVLRRMSPGVTLYGAVGGLLKITQSGEGGGRGVGYAVSARHIGDFFNAQAILGPFVFFLFAVAAVIAIARRRPWDSAAGFLSIAAASFALGSGALGEPLLGYARDWDLFAPAGVCYATAGVFLVCREAAARPRVCRWLAAATVLSVINLAAWVDINHSEAASLARMKTLPLGGGRAGVVVGSWYYRQARRGDAMDWFHRALAEDPHNANANSFMGVMLAEDKRMEEASVYLAKAVRWRPDKAEFRRNYAHALVDLGRCDGASRQLRWLATRNDGDSRYWHQVGERMIAVGCGTAFLAKVYGPLLRRIDTELEARPGDEGAHVDAGLMLARIDRYDEALAHYRAALRTNPGSASALFNAAVALERLGRPGEAARLYARFVGRHPNHPQAGYARERMDP